MRHISILICLCCLATSAWAKPLPADRIPAAEPLAPYFSVLPDPQGTQSYEEISSPNLVERFTPLQKGFPLRASGPVWLRLVIIRTIPPGAPGYTPAHLMMNMGDLPPGSTKIYLPAESSIAGARGAVVGEVVAPFEKILLPEPGITPTSVYIRMSETPGLWFSPLVGPSPLSSGDTLPLELIFLGLLPAAALLCLLRCVKDKAVWPLWVSLFLACVLLQDLLPLPGAGSPFKPADLPTLLAPGLGLMILAHLGRVLLQTKQRAPAADLFLICGMLPGVALCLMPLVPGFSWLVRIFPLWPLPTLLFLPIGLAALARKQSGALAYTGACFFAAAGAGCTLAALFMPLPPLADSAWLWGLAAAGVCLTLAGSPREDAPSTEETEAEDAVLHNLPPLRLDAFSKGAPAGAPLGGTLADLPKNSTDGPLSLSGPTRGQKQGLSLASDEPPAPAPSTFADPALEFTPAPTFADPALEFLPAAASADALTGSSSASAGPGSMPDRNAAPRNDSVRADSAQDDSALTLTPASAPGSGLKLAADTAGNNSAANTPPPALIDSGLDLGPLPTSGPVLKLEPAPKAQAKSAGRPLVFSGAEAFRAVEPLSRTSASGGKEPQPQAEKPAGNSSPLAQEQAAPQEQPAPQKQAAPAVETPTETDPAAVADGSASPVVSAPSVPSAPSDDLFDMLDLTEPDQPDAAQPEAVPAPSEAAGTATPVTQTEAPVDVEESTPDAVNLSAVMPGGSPATGAGMTEHDLAAGPAATSRRIAPEIPRPRPIATAEPRIISLVDDDLSFYNLDPLASPPPNVAPEHSGAAYIFNLHSLVREAHAATEALAASKGLLLSWFAAPTVPGLLEGDAPRLRQALTLLMQNAVQACRRGSVQVTVRQSPDAQDDDNTCTLLFSVSDSGSGRRTDAGFFQAWELASHSGGAFRVHYQAGSGTTVNFSVRFRLPTEERIQAHYEELGALADPTDDEPEERLSALEEMVADLLPDFSPRGRPDSGLPGAVVADTTTGTKKLLNHHLKGLAFETAVAAGPEQAQVLYAARPASLVVFDADMPESDTAAAVAAIRRYEGEHSLKPAVIMALVGHEAQRGRMRALGCTAELHKPFDAESLRQAVAAALPELGLSAEPAAADAAPMSEPPKVANHTEELEMHLERLILAPDFLPEAPVVKKSSSLFDLRKEDVTPAKELQHAPTPAEKTQRSSSLPEKAQRSASARPAVSSDEVPLLDLIITSDAEDENTPQEDAQASASGREAMQSQNLTPVHTVSPVQPLTPIPSPISIQLTPDTPPPAKEPASAAPTTPVAVSASVAPAAPAIISVSAAPAAPANAPPAGMPLAGLEETLQLDMLPLLPGLIYALRDALRFCTQGLGDNSPIFVQEAAGRLAEHAQSFGLEKLGKIARCVERAAQADDLEAVRTLLDDLHNVTLRYVGALQEAYDAYIREAR